MIRLSIMASMVIGPGPAFSSSGEPGLATGPTSAVDGPDPLAGQDVILDFRVVDARDGTPLPDVSIVVVAAGASGATALATGEDGHCRIVIPDEARQFIGISARKEGFIPIRVAWRGDEIDSGLPGSYTLALELGTSIGGTIRDTRGRPVAGAGVYIFLQKERPRKEHEQVFLADDYSVKTDAQGRWRCSMMTDRLDEGDILAFRLVHPDFVSEPLVYDRRLPLAELRGMTAVMVMEDGVALAGRVVNSGGFPVEKARLFLQTPGVSVDSASLTPEQAGCLLAESDTDGRFRFGHIKPGERQVTVEAQGYVPQNVRVVVGADPEPTEIRLMTLEEMEEAADLAILEFEQMAATAEDEGDDEDPNGIARGWVEVGVLAVVAVAAIASLAPRLWRAWRRG